MNTADSHDHKPKFLDRLSGFLTRHRLTFVVALIVAAVGVVGLFVFLEVASNRTEKALQLVEALQDSYANWAALDDATRESDYADLLAQVDRIRDSYPRSYATQRALFVHASALADLGRWAEASAEYRNVADGFPESYLAPMSLTLAAVAAENADDPAGALEILTLLVDEYDSESAEIPRALFSIARIQETTGSIAEAAARYNQLIEEHPASGWTNLARDRIITLTAQGRIGS